MLEVIYLGGIVTAGIIWYWNRRRSQQQSTRARAVSFNSEIMLRGTFPSTTQAQDTVINAVLYFKNCPSTIQLELVCKKLLFYDRYRSAVSKIGNKWTFVDLGAEAININRDHLDTVYATSHEDILRIVDEICSTSIFEVEGKPLWKIFRIINKNPSEPSVVLYRVHHSIGDGMSLIGTMANLFTNADGSKIDLDIPQKMGNNREASNSFSASKIIRYITTAFQVLTLPNSHYDSDIAFTAPNKRKLIFSKHRKTVIFPTLKLSFIKDLKNRAGVTVNDILLTATAGAIRRYSILKDDPLFSRRPLPSLSCRALIPVTFPRNSEDLSSPSRSLRNLWSFVSAPLPLQGATSKERLVECAQTMNKIKSSPWAGVQLWIQNNILPLVPDFFRHQITQDLFSRHSIVFSNVPGPSEPMYLCGEKLLGIQGVFQNLVAQVRALYLVYSAEFGN